MHILTTRNPVKLGKDRTLEPDVYLVEDISGAQLMVHADGDRMEPVPVNEAGNREFTEELAWDEKKILITRVGGIGDIILLTPIIRELNSRWPTAKIDVVCHPEFGQPLQNLPYVNAIIPYPIKLADAKTYDCWIFFENAVERGDHTTKLHSVDCYAQRIGLTGEFDKRQEYRVTESERIWAKEGYPRINGTRRICVQTNASAACRSYPRAKLQQVVAELLKKGWEVFLMDRPGGVKLDPEEKIPDGLRVLTDGLTFRHRAAVMETSDCVLAPDSSLTHLAGALSVPCVSLFGPFHSDLRTKYNDTTFAINGKGDCAPCNPHNRMGMDFPAKCPSKARGVCEVLENIKPERVIEKIEKVARGFGKLEVLSDVAE